MYEDKMDRYSHQCVINNLILWINKYRTKWFATHDFDEYICPITGTWSKNNSNIKDYLQKLANNINYIETKMYRTTLPTHGYPLAPTISSTRPMWCWHKFIVKTKDVNLLWVHIPTNWEKKKYEKP